MSSGLDMIALRLNIAQKVSDTGKRRGGATVLQASHLQCGGKRIGSIFNISSTDEKFNLLSYR